MLFGSLIQISVFSVTIMTGEEKYVVLRDDATFEHIGKSF